MKRLVIALLLFPVLAHAGTVAPENFSGTRAKWLGAALTEIYPEVDKWRCRVETNRGTLDLFYCAGYPRAEGLYRARFLVEFDRRAKAARILAVGAFSRTSRRYELVFPAPESAALPR